MLTRTKMIPAVLLRIAVFACSLFTLQIARAGSIADAPIQIHRIRVGSHPTYTRVVLEAGGTIEFSHHLVKGPDRILIDMKNARLGTEGIASSYDIADGIIRKIDFHPGEGGSLAIEVALDRMTHYDVQELTDPPRFVLDIYGKRAREARLLPSSREASPVPKSPTPLPPPSKVDQNLPTVDSFNTIVLDPGHGGKDPGAIGRTGLREKDIVLDVARRLQVLLVGKLGKKVIMTRDSDIFIPLGRRTQIANENNADLFVSIHANASPQRSTNGIEVYLFGEASDRRAAETAARENAALEEDGSTLNAIMKSLTLEYKLNESIEFAHLTRRSFKNTLGKRYRFNDLGVKAAPFFVLVKAAMPSILAEVSFITNPVEEKRLKSPAYRQKIAESLFEGIRVYIASNKIKS